jgi:5-methylcytosine-specific restriction protein B
MKSFLESPIKPDISELTGLGKTMAPDFVRIASDKSPMYINQKQLNRELIRFFDELKNIGAEFGYRTAFEINRFAGIISFMSDGKYDHNDIVDAAIIQKLLPKLHGSRNQLVPVLEKLAALCLNDEKIENVKTKLKMDQVAGNDPDVKYPLSFEKIHRMHSRAIKDGFTSFAEA